VFLALTGHDAGESEVSDSSPDASPNDEKELEAVR